MSNALPNTLGTPCADGRLPLTHPWRRITLRTQRATRAYRQLGMDLNDAIEAVGYSQRTDIVQLHPETNTADAMRHWDRAALAVLNSPSLTVADLHSVARLAAGLLRVADPCWAPHTVEGWKEAGLTQSDYVMSALYRALSRIEANAEKGGAK